MAHIGQKITLGMVGPIRNVRSLTQELAFFRFGVNHKQVSTDKSEQQQHQDTCVKNHAINIGYAAGNGMPGNIADKGTVRTGQIRSKQEVFTLRAFGINHRRTLPI